MSEQDSNNNNKKRELSPTPSSSSSSSKPTTETTNNEEEWEEETPIQRKDRKKARNDCPYLDTINRHMLDFDLEKLCSVTLSHLNVYACLVCGKYFQGKSKTSPAHFHSLEANHHVFIHLENKRVICLPEDYEVLDSSLADIIYLLDPTFTKEQLVQFDTSAKFSTALDGSLFLNGMVGLNNVKNTDYINSILQVLVHIPPLRNFFLIKENYAGNKSGLVQRFGELTRKMWNPKNFKAQVLPHELLQEIQAASDKKFKIGQPADPMDFLQWILNTLHKELGGTRKKGSSIIYQLFQGELSVKTETPHKKKEEGESNEVQDPINTEFTTSTSTLPFLTLSMDLPVTPLFKEEIEKNIIPQVPLYTLLSKFDGKTLHNIITGERKTYIITRLPKYLVMQIRRFNKNNYFFEKNPTIANFPVKNLEMREYTTNEPSVGVTKFDLISCVKHEGTPAKGIYSVYVQNKGNEQWYEIQDLTVKDTIPHLIVVSEAYILVYEQKKE
eukprot:TRINITY_DN4448_c0_g2_i3.p1 TRINITY_DN4448_c0_g2~~TRINITY_DN4448_c0_g2_i3.p1  ORF type:complete len:520 (-),score=144.91 TRINITY_DN4448_c0_g2_i3:46-1542(-)